jgi:hypothetical protein
VSPIVIRGVLDICANKWKIGYDSYTMGRAEAEQDWQNASKMDTGLGASMSTAAESQRLIQLASMDEAAFKAYE